MTARATESVRAASSITIGNPAQRATAVVLAGGTSERMGRDKSLLPIRGQSMTAARGVCTVPLIEHVCAQVRPYFGQILVAADDTERFAFLGVDLVQDQAPGLGPLMGIASALEVSAYDLNFVVACDIPAIDMPFVRRMLWEAVGVDAVVPKTERGHFEPLFAVYRRSALPAFHRSLAAGRRKVIAALEHCYVKHVALPESVELGNVNTLEDYECLLRPP